MMAGGAGRGGTGGAASGGWGAGGATGTGGQAGGAGRGGPGGLSETGGRGGTSGAAGSGGRGGMGAVAGSGGRGGTSGAAGTSAGGASGAGGGLSSCQAPQALTVAESSGVFDLGVASSATAGIGLLWSRWPQGDDPHFTSYDSNTGQFTTKLLPDGSPSSATRHVALTALPDGRLAAIWTAGTGLIVDRFYLSVGPETATPFTNEIESTTGVRTGSFLSVAPFDGKVAIAWGEIAHDSASEDRYHVFVRIYDLSATSTAAFDVIPPDDTLMPIPQLYTSGDNLIVLLTQSPPTSYPTTLLSLARITRTTASGAIAAKSLVTTGADLIPPSLILQGGNIRLGYNDGHNLVLRTYDLDGNALGTSVPVTPLAADNSRGIVGRDQNTNHVLWTDPSLGRVLRYAALGAADTPISPVMVATPAEIPAPMGFLRGKTGGLFIGWYSYGGAVHLTPICSQ